MDSDSVGVRVDSDSVGSPSEVRSWPGNARAVDTTFRSPVPIGLVPVSTDQISTDLIFADLARTAPSCADGKLARLIGHGPQLSTMSASAEGASDERSSGQRASPGGAVAASLGLGIAGLLTGLLVGLLGLSMLSVVVAVEPNTALTSAVSVTAQGVGLVVVVALYLLHRQKSWSYLRVRWPSLRDLLWTVATTIGLFAALAALLVIVQQLGLSPTEHSVAEAGQQNPEILLPLIPLSVLITGPAEELLYRGVIQTRLRESFGTVAAVALASVVFAVVHAPAYGLGAGLGPDLLTTLVILFILGAFLGAAYEYTGNLVVPAVAHGLYNAVVFGTQYATATGVI